MNEKIIPIAIITLIILSTLLASCEAVTGIFKAGMGFGIFIVIAIIIVVVFIVMKVGKGKSS